MTRPNGKYRRNQGPAGLPATWTDKAYRGYLIRRTLTGEYWIERDRTRICGAVSVDDAQRQINELLD
jgi:hypothetical protein